MTPRHIVNQNIGISKSQQDRRFRAALSPHQTSLHFGSSTISANKFVGLRLGPDLATNAAAETASETPPLVIDRGIARKGA